MISAAKATSHDLAKSEADVIATIKELLKKQLVFQLNATFIDFCTQKLKMPATEICSILYALVQRKILVPGSTLTREQILENSTRLSILKLIQANPGIHVRELCQKIEINNSVVRSHLKVLETFNYIRRRDYANPKITLLFTKEFPDKYDDFFVIWKSETDRQIIELLLREELNITEFSAKLQLHHSTIQYHIEKLSKFDMLVKESKDQSVKFRFNNEKLGVFDEFLALITSPALHEAQNRTP